MISLLHCESSSHTLDKSFHQTQPLQVISLGFSVCLRLDWPLPDSNNLSIANADDRCFLCFPKEISVYSGFQGLLGTLDCFLREFYSFSVYTQVYVGSLRSICVLSRKQSTIRFFSIQNPLCLVIKNPLFIPGLISCLPEIE